MRQALLFVAAFFASVAASIDLTTPLHLTVATPADSRAFEIEYKAALYRVADG